MKNIIKSFFLVAMTALMLFSCTNVNDPTELLNSEGKTYAMYVDAILLKGLDGSFNDKDAEVSFSYVTGYDKDGKAIWKTEKASGFTIGKSGDDKLVLGTGFVKLTTPVKIVAYENVKPEDAIVKIEAKVGDKNLKIAKSTLLTEFEDANKLAIVESAYGTKEANYPHKYLSIQTASKDISGNNIASVFSWADTPKKNDYKDIIPFFKYWVNSNFGYFEMSSNDNVNFTLEFEWNQAEVNDWGVSEGTLAFGIGYAKNDWNPAFKDAKFAVGDDFVDCFKGGTDNNKASGLVTGKTYVLTLKVKDPDTLSLKIEEKKQ